MKGDDNVSAESFVIALVCVDELMTIGKPGDVKKVFQELHTSFLLEGSRFASWEP